MRRQYAENWLRLVGRERASVREGFFEEIEEQSQRMCDN